LGAQVGFPSQKSLVCARGIGSSDNKAMCDVVSVLPPTVLSLVLLDIVFDASCSRGIF